VRETSAIQSFTLKIAAVLNERLCPAASVWSDQLSLRGYKLQESAKMYAPILKRYQLQRGFAPNAL